MWWTLFQRLTHRIWCECLHSRKPESFSLKCPRPHQLRLEKQPLLSLVLGVSALNLFVCSLYPLLFTFFLRYLLFTFFSILFFVSWRRLYICPINTHANKVTYRKFYNTRNELSAKIAITISTERDR